MSDIRKTMDETIEMMARARDAMRDSIPVEAELREKIATQRAIMAVALGYIRAGRADLAGLVLGGDNRPDECPKCQCPKCVGEVAP